MSPTVERANKLLMERHSASSFRVPFGVSLLVNLLLAAAVTVVAIRWANETCAAPQTPAESNLNEAFRAWKALHGQAYNSSQAEAAAFAQYQATDAYITAANQQNLSFTLGHNAFSAMPFEQFFHRGIVPHNSSHPKRYYNSSLAGGRRLQTAPATKDWRTEGYVTPVKNQGQCGSCWSFATSGTLEAGYKAATGHLVSFSEQNLVSCANIGGCDGSNFQMSFGWVRSHGDSTEAEYPYTEAINSPSTDATNPCTTSREQPFVTLTDYYDVSSSDLLQVVGTHGPVAVTIAVSCCPSNDGFQSYSGGVIGASSSNSGTDFYYSYGDYYGRRLQQTSCEPDHAVLIVGYNTVNSVDYWIVKNSWGTSWGDGGYFYVERGSNTCLIESGAVVASGVEAYSSGR